MGIFLCADLIDNELRYQTNNNKLKASFIGRMSNKQM